MKTVYDLDDTPEKVTPELAKQKELRERLERTADGLEEFTKTLLKDGDKVRNRKRDE